MDLEFALICLPEVMAFENAAARAKVLVLEAVIETLIIVAGSPALTNLRRRLNEPEVALALHLGFCFAKSIVFTTEAQ